MTTRITGIVRDLEGQPLVNSHIRFERRSGVRGQDGATVVPRVVNAKTDSGGNIAVDLYPGEYTAQAERGSGALSFKVGVPEDVAQVQLQDLIDQIPSITPTWASETRQARDQAVEAAESTAGSAEAAEDSASAASASADAASDSATAASESQVAAEGAQQGAEEARDEAEVFASVSPRVIYVATIADLQALDTSPLPDGQQVSVAENGNLYTWNSSEWDRVDPEFSSVEAESYGGDGVTQSATDTTAGRVILTDHGWTAGNLIGTVSQSGGDPTGAVIERGSNSNGEYVRFADGTQMCWGAAALTFPASSESADSPEVTYPAAFASSDVIITTGVVRGVYAATSSKFIFFTAPSASSFTLRGWNLEPLGSEYTANARWCAISRWF